MKELVELKQKAQDLGELVSQLGDSLDLTKLNETIKSLEEEQNKDGFWNDQRAALQVVSNYNDAKKKVDTYTRISKEYKDLEDLLEASDDDDSEMKELITSTEEELDKDINSFRAILLFSGEYDGLNATLEVHPGAGGTEAQDWADMLFRMYGRWAEKNSFKFQVLSYENGEEAGLKSAVIKICGHNVYGLLKGEKGVHRLVRISPFDANARRHTSFASVNVVPEFGSVSDVVIDPKDLRVDTFRSGGAGGQNVNKVSSAVRITHIPSGIVVQCEIERSQLMNKATCMEMLADKLMQKKLEERDQKMKSIVGEQKNIEWGSQIRSYVFCPYTMVKDNRTGYETADVNGVMDGDIDPFIYAYLEMEAKNGQSVKKKDQ
ncbi:MAG: peptide chain release factor 2 [Bacilli bacterium]|nr:peptide chain release factor 2 [Bacilli bacterium]MCH4210171.1 peptide chain release factor 2 [Bacilli bacterium]